VTDLKALMGLAEKATKRPWKTDGDAIVETDWDGVHERPVSFDEEYDPDICEVLTGENRKNDAAYICAACNAVPDLIQRLQAAEEALKFYAEQWHYIDRFHGHGHYSPSNELVDDSGDRARAALTPPTKSEEKR
jgi:hypothetical protein